MERELDDLFAQIDDALLTGRLDRVDTRLRCCDPEGYSTEYLIGLLTATYPARDRLPARKLFFAAVKESLQRRGEDVERLLTGLE